MTAAAPDQLLCMCQRGGCLQADASASSTKLDSDCQFLRSLNETLMSNQKQFQGQVAALQEQLAAKDAAVQDLQEQVGLDTSN